MDRLFVPLNKGPFESFKSGKKKFELRGYGSAYTEKHVYPGRKVELRKGYSGESLWGAVGRIYSGSLDGVLKDAGYGLIIPEAATEEAAKSAIIGIMGEKHKYIAFEVILERQNEL